MLISQARGWITKAWARIESVFSTAARVFTRPFIWVWRARNLLAGSILLIALITMAMVIINHFIGFQKCMQLFQIWLGQDNHWKLLLAIVVAVTLLTWNYVAPTLRTIFGNNWHRLIIWGLTGIILLLFARFGWPEDAIAYRLTNLGCLMSFLVILGIIAKRWHPRPLPTSESPYAIDNPKAHREDPLYESQVQIVGDIQHLIAGEHVSTFAISGRWGIGKTFLLDRVRKSLAEDKSIIWVDFEPWRYASEEALIRGFYDDIGKKLAKDIPGIQHIARPLVETAEKFVKKQDASGILGTFIELLRAPFTSPIGETPEEQIGSLLAHECRRLVIVIDDVDRSFTAERIFRALQLAHFTKNIINVQVIFLCDKEVVLKARPQHFDNPAQDSTEYLEKFVEREVVVPSPRPSELRQLFAALGSQSGSSNDFDISGDDLSNEMLTSIATPRAVIRVFNEFMAYRINAAKDD